MNEGDRKGRGRGGGERGGERRGRGPSRPREVITWTL